LASRSGAPIVPLFVRRRGHFEYEFVIHRAIELDKSSAPEALQAAAQMATDAMAAFIQKTPTQWFNF
jgi:lauroyl/myristoyl acyltransferase